LECAPLKVSDSIPFGANFGGQVHTELCSGLEWGPPQVGGGIGPLGLAGPWIGYRVLKKKVPLVASTKKY